jgi:hypothetical protein
MITDREEYILFVAQRYLLNADAQPSLEGTVLRVKFDGRLDWWDLFGRIWRAGLLYDIERHLRNFNIRVEEAK